MPKAKALPRPRPARSVSRAACSQVKGSRYPSRVMPRLIDGGRQGKLVVEGARARLEAAFHESVRGLKLGEMIGCGAVGCVFSTNRAKVVVKITRDGREAAAAQAILGGLRSPVLPKIYQVLSFTQPHPTHGRSWVGQTWFAIVREDLTDIPSKDAVWWERCWGDDPSFSAERPTSRSKPGRTCRAGTGPTAMRRFMADLDELLLKDGRWEVADLHSSNLGRSGSSAVKIRDTGFTYLGDRSPFLSGPGESRDERWLAMVVAGVGLGLGLLAAHAVRGGR